MNNTSQNSIVEIQKFLQGKNDELKYLVNVETDPNDNCATCIIHEPGKDKELIKVPFTPFLYIKNLEKHGYSLFNGNIDKEKIMKNRYGITIEKMKTGGHARLENGFPYKVTSTKCYQAILDFFKEAGLDPFEKIYHNGQLARDVKGNAISKYRELFYLPKLNDQFFISTGARLFKGIEEYKDLHKLTFDIETTGLRYQHSRIFAIGVKDNRGFEILLEVDEPDSDEAEIGLIQKFFNLISLLKPAVISGYNSEMFDFEFILGRAEILGIDISKLPTTLNAEKKMWRRNATVKFGNSTETYKATVAWGYTVLDILHAVKRTVAVNTDIKNNKLKYICKYEGIAKPDRMYIDGKDGDIYKFWKENPMFIINPQNNEYVKVPKEFQEAAMTFYILQRSADKITVEEYNKKKRELSSENKEFVSWVKENSTKILHGEKGNIKFIEGKNILRRYVLDDLWETEQVDNLYNQSSFMLAKIVPTTYGRVATMGNAAIWNLLMTTWSYENDLAIPHPDEQERFSGGLTRCFKKGYTKRLGKIDYASLYPMIQLTWDVFPMFDITGVIKKMLTYMTTTRNIYKKLAASKKLNSNEENLLQSIDMETYHKYLSDSFTDDERNLFKVKQLPIKILNNSLFGALGSGYAFNWSDNICAARITCTGRLDLRHAISWFESYGLTALLAVTDGVNFGIPDETTIKIDDATTLYDQPSGKIEEMWKYNDKVGLAALIEKYNKEEMKAPYMSVDNDGEFKACLNLSRINYAVETLNGKIKFTGNTIKSKTMPEYIEEFIDKGMKLILDGKGEEFVDYYQSYAEKIFYKQIPLKKIASKSKVKTKISDYLDRGINKRGQMKAKQAHMELIIAERMDMAMKFFSENFEKFNADTPSKKIEDYDVETIMDMVSTYLPPEPELDSVIYYVNTGTRKSHGDVKTDPNTGETIINARMINTKDLEENPDMTGEYNVDKYLDAFNKRVEVLLDGFDPEVREKILVKIKRSKVKDASGAKVEQVTLEKEMFTSDQLVLKNFNHDDFDEAMHLEDKEVEFWNRTGYDPRLVWNGFKMHENNKVYFDIYEHAINYVSDMMVKANKPKVKSVNDKLFKGDYVLIKNFNKYNLGYHNGNYVQIVREDIKIPKSNTELMWEEKQKEEDAKLAKLRVEEQKMVDDVLLKSEQDNHKMVELFKEFKKQFNLAPYIQMDALFEEVPEAKAAFEDFVRQQQEDMLPDYVFEDDGDY